jgi:hypothetical protein
VDHRTVHKAREYLLEALDFLEDAENQRDAAAQSHALGLAGRTALEGVNLISRARRAVSSQRRVSGGAEPGDSIA